MGTVAVTLEEVLALDAFAGARLISGGRSLRNAIRTVTVGEVPNSSQYLSGGELMLTSFYLYRDMPASVLSAVVQSVAEAGAAGLVYKPGSAIRSLPPQAAKIAEAKGLPVIEVPEDRRWPVLIEAVLDLIKHQERATLKRAWDIQHDLLQTMLSGGGLRGLCHTLGRQFGCPVEVLDLHLRPVAGWAPEAAGVRDRADGGGEELYRWLAQSGHLNRALESGEAVQMVPPSHLGPVRLVLPVAAEAQSLGYMILGSSLRRLSDVGILAARETCSLAAMEMLKLRAADEAGARSRDVFLQRLLGGSALRVVEEEPALPYRGVVMVLRPPAGMPTALAEVKAELRRLSGAESEPYVTMAHSDVVVLLPYDDVAGLPGDVDGIVRRLRAALHRVWGTDAVPAVGLGRPCRTLSDVRQGYRDAVRALELAVQVREPQRVATFNDSALYEFLLRSLDRGELEVFSQNLLRPLAEHDRKHRGDLLNTLLTFLECNRSLAETADRLHMHRNSVAYRLRKIQDISALDFANQDQIVAWYLALKLPSLLASRDEGLAILATR